MTFPPGLLITNYPNTTSLSFKWRKKPRFGRVWCPWSGLRHGNPFTVSGIGDEDATRVSSGQLRWQCHCRHGPAAPNSAQFLQRLIYNNLISLSAVHVTSCQTAAFCGVVPLFSSFWGGLCTTSAFVIRVMWAVLPSGSCHLWHIQSYSSCMLYPFYRTSPIFPLQHAPRWK